ncbi:MAG: glycoside hydrolase family 66 protein [Ginsengibacter sp.]
MMMNFVLIISWFLLSMGCKKNSTVPGRPDVHPVTDTLVNIVTDKAVYNPGDVIHFTIDKELPSTARIRFRKLDKVISETNVTGSTFTLTAPPADFTGYMVDIYNQEKGVEKVYGATAVDVSSDWTKFPRYGFLSAYGELTHSHMDSVINNLSRLHINGLQFYDWDYEHHQPLAGTVADPAASWLDIASRTNYKSTVDYYISAAHGHNMKAMSYNLCYGALNDAAEDGVPDQWYMYKDQHHSQKVFLSLSSPFKSNIYLTNPGNASWQQYLAGKTQDMYDVYAFDGYHVDQVGDLGIHYDYDGNRIDVPAGFASFLDAMKAAAPSKRLVMNAVNQFGQEGNIATSPVDFTYTEVWSPNESYKDLAAIIQNNIAWSDNKKATVITAYMDYNVANHTGYFNTPGVLLTDAVIFAYGASHLEMGEHMLCKEYFPNDNLKMKPDLQQALIHYYDFLTGYENLLRDGGVFNQPDIVSADGKTTINNFPPQTGSISVTGKDLGSAQVIHLINFANATSFDWRDTNGTQAEPKTFQNISYILTTGKKVKNLWMASPDINGGVAQHLPFTSSGNTISFTLPSLKYWDMIVAEY